MVTRVGYLGVGTIGRPLAENVLKSGFELMVYDPSPDAVQAMTSQGARAARSARELGEFAEVVELSVTDDAAVIDSILGKDGALAGARAGTVIAIHSTIHPRTALRVAGAAMPKGVGVLDASVSGGGAGVRSRTVVWMVGGEAADLEKVRPVLEASGKAVFHMGALGMGCSAKVAQQMITTVNMLGAYEGFRVAKAAGLDMDAFSEALKLSSGQSRMADTWLEGFFNGMPAHMREGFYKGLIPCLTLSHELGVSAPGAALIQQTFPEFPDPLLP